MFLYGNKRILFMNLIFLIRPDGRKYIGEWYNDKQNGKGVYVSADGQKREGEWKDGKKIRWMTDGIKARIT